MATFLIAAHVAAGTIGLLLAGPVLLAPKRRGWHTRLGRGFLACVAVVCASAVALFAREPGRLWVFLLIALLTGVAAGGGLMLALRRPPGWLLWHLRLMASSVISFVTAFLFQATDANIVAVLLPSVLGSPLIAYQAKRVQSWKAAPRTRQPEPTTLAS